ncbi:MAG: glycosyltransferase family 1 protein [Miniphocaeibacter sp.]|uniref:glycosyltransferase family 1 protein n=1 Tax=Miniphocaeibacter sp. TaxID=3100973 RepID=UPI003BAF1DBA
MKRMIYHIPYYVDKNRHSGSHIRPFKMLDAFKKIGYDVDVIMGYAAQREEAIDKIKDNILNGVIYDFCYSESSTMPTLLTEKNHLPTHPFLDFGFFKFLKNHGVKIGLFYRDTHWLFEQYKNTVSKPKQLISTFFYKYDLKKYKKYIDIIYMPDKKMNDYLPISLGSNIQNLPPALDEEKIYNYSPKNEFLNIFYVGGLGDLYNLELFFKVIFDLDFIHFTLCTRESEWNNQKEIYKKYMTDRINVINGGPGEYDVFLEESDIALLFAEPKKYWNFAIPVKLFEYIKFKKPIISVKKTATSRIIEKYKIGFTVDYNEDLLKDKLIHIYKNKNKLTDLIPNFNMALEENTWEARARKVAKDLS